jgi:hypothetical protein
MSIQGASPFSYAEQELLGYAGFRSRIRFVLCVPREKNLHFPSEALN